MFRSFWLHFFQIQHKILDLFKEGFETIIAIDLPKKRALMHLDTIFTRISKEEVIIKPNYGAGSDKIFIRKNNFLNMGKNYIVYSHTVQFWIS